MQHCIGERAPAGVTLLAAERSGPGLRAERTVVERERANLLAEVRRGMHVVVATDGSRQSLAAARYLMTVADPLAAQIDGHLRRPLVALADALIVGAGFTGLGAAIKLRQAGVDDIVVVERADRVGGGKFSREF